MTTSQPLKDSEFIKSSINYFIKLAIDEEFEKAKQRIEERKSEIVAGVMLNIQKHIQLNNSGENIIITIIK